MNEVRTMSDGEVTAGRKHRPQFPSHQAVPSGGVRREAVFTGLGGGFPQGLHRKAACCRDRGRSCPRRLRHPLRSGAGCADRGGERVRNRQHRLRRIGKDAGGPCGAFRIETAGHGERQRRGTVDGNGETQALTGDERMSRQQADVPRGWIVGGEMEVGSPRPERQPE